MTVDEDVRAFNDACERALAEQDAEALIAIYTEDRTTRADDIGAR